MRVFPDRNCILLVDDDVINRTLLKNIFSSHFTFEEADNGLDGLRLAQTHEHKLCAILLDVSMPGLNGIDLLRRLYESGFTQRVPVFLITANDEESLAKEAYELGVMDVITKPVTSFIILRRVQSVIELFQAREQLSQTVAAQGQKLQENADTIDTLHRNTIEALASAIEFRDVESGHHTSRIYSITKYLLTHTAIGEGMTAEEIENIAIGSIMHDVGKIAISDVILNKPGRLTQEEYEIMKLHTVKGAALMEQLMKMQTHPSYHYALDIARHHHERWDGSGYPDGLKGDEITVWSQVVAIADIYDALISPRVYKQAYSPDEAVEMFKRGQCGVHNPKLLECFYAVEPEIRKFYFQDEDDVPSQSIKAPAQPVGRVFPAPATQEELQPIQEVIDVLLLTAAVRSAYDLIISVNLTQNSYYMIDYSHFLTRTAKRDGVFDDLIAASIPTIPEPDRQQFSDTFSRQPLLDAFASGKTSIHLTHRQYTDDGQLRTVATSVLFMQDPSNGDVRQITISRYLYDDDMTVN